jgi:Domain of unknown function (DUF397)
MNGTSTAQQWRRSSYCTDTTCVEVAMEPTAVAVRDSKQPAGAVLRFTPAEWRAFVSGVRNGEFEPRGSGAERAQASRAASSRRRSADSAADRASAYASSNALR